jgi:DNA-binding CsgD family transcriptional regulator
MLQPSTFDRVGGVDRVGPPDAEGSCAARERRVRARAAIAAVDAFLEVLEQRRDGARERIDADLLLRWLWDLENMGLVAPVAVSGATTAAQLNEGLLDWQEELLDVAYPRRVIPMTAGGRVPPGHVVGHTHRRRWHPPPRRAALWSARPSIRLAVLPDAEAPRGADTMRAGRDPNGLTERELTVLRVVAEGLTNAQVAHRLHLSEHTVAAHLRSIFRKTDVASRSGATRYALEHGLT